MGGNYKRLCTSGVLRHAPFQVRQKAATNVNQGVVILKLATHHLARWDNMVHMQNIFSKKKGRPKGSKNKNRMETTSKGQLDLIVGLAPTPQFTPPTQKFFLPAAPLGFMRLSEPSPTEIFKTYWSFASERQALFFRKLSHPQSACWTDNPILRKYKFTNVYRASDRVSQYLIRRVIYDGPQEPEDVFFRTILFKLFNKIETWELLEREVGSITWKNFDFKRYDEILSAAINNSTTIYSAAYIMASGKSAFGHARKHSNHLCLLEKMMIDRLPLRIQQQPSMQAVYELIREYPSIGSFLAYQYAIDLNYGLLTEFSENDFVMPGPGSLDGISKCFSNLGDYTPADTIRWMVDQQNDAFSNYGLEFQDLWGRPLHLIDCQNLFCEVDKYSRVRHPNIVGRSKRTRIKQEYRRVHSSMDYWYPPKWGINMKIMENSG